MRDPKEMREDYSELLSEGVRGKYYERFTGLKGLVQLAPDIHEAFPNPEDVDVALRTILREAGQQLSLGVPVPIEDALRAGETHAWTLWSPASKQYLVVPHAAYPGRRPMHLFRERQDALQFKAAILEANPQLRDANLEPLKVALDATWRSVAEGKMPGIDGVVLHSVSEVMNWIASRSPSAQVGSPPRTRST